MKRGTQLGLSRPEDLPWVKRIVFFLEPFPVTLFTLERPGADI
jgi:hypothetical protein